MRPSSISRHMGIADRGCDTQSGNEKDEAAAKREDWVERL